MEMNNNVQPPQPRRTQSRVGIAAFISGCLSVCVLLGYLAFIYVIAKNTILPGFPVLVAWIAALVLGGLLGLAGLIMGIAALFQKKNKKLFAILAILGSILAFVLMVLAVFSIFIFTA